MTKKTYGRASIEERTKRTIDYAKERYSGNVICPVCKIPCELVSNEVIYGKKQGSGWVWICPNFKECDCYVGAHEYGVPLGTPAPLALRSLRIETHKFIDPLWNSHEMKGVRRAFVYRVLAIHLSIPAIDCHIAKFDESQCRLAIDFAQKVARGEIELALIVGGIKKGFDEWSEH